MAEEKKPTQRPSIGRIVHYTPTDRDGVYFKILGGPPKFTALVAFVHDDELSVNLAVHDHAGQTWPLQRVPHTEAPAGSEAARGCWSWPEHVPPRAG